MTRRTAVGIQWSSLAIILVLLAAFFAYDYVITSSQVSSLNGQVSTLSGQISTLKVEVSSLSSASSQAANWRSIADLGKSVVLANNVRAFANCTSPQTGLPGGIVAFQANYSGYLLVTSNDFANNNEALPALVLVDLHSLPPSYVGPRLSDEVGYFGIGILSSQPHPIADIIPVSPTPGNITLDLFADYPFCVTGANATGTFSATYYY